MGTPNKVSRYDEAFKREAVALVVERGQSITAAARQVGVNKDSLRDWVRQVRGASVEPTEISDSQRLRDLERENRQLRQERDILKEAVGIFSQRPK